MNDYSEFDTVHVLNEAKIFCDLLHYYIFQYNRNHII